MNKKSLLLLALVIFAVSLFSVSTSKFDAYPNMYTDSPKSIIVLPPINYSTAADAKEYLACTITKPLAEAGYYVFPIDVTNEFLKAEGLYDTELINDEIILQFNKITGADAVLIPELIYWDKNYYILGGNVKVGVRYTLKSTYTAEVLWIYEGMLTVDTSSNQGGGGGLGLLISLAATAIQTAAQDYFPIAEKANDKIFKNIPYGSYHKKHDMDRTSYIYYPKKNADFMEAASQPRPSREEIKASQLNTSAQTGNTKSISTNTATSTAAREVKPIYDTRNQGFEYVILKDSRVVNGEVVYNKKNKIKVLDGTKLITISKDAIDHIEDHEELDITEEVYAKKYGKLNFNRYNEFEKIN